MFTTDTPGEDAVRAANKGVIPCTHMNMFGNSLQCDRLLASHTVEACALGLASIRRIRAASSPAQKLFVSVHPRHAWGGRCEVS